MYEGEGGSEDAKRLVNSVGDARKFVTAMF